MGLQGGIDMFDHSSISQALKVASQRLRDRYRIAFHTRLTQAGAIKVFTDVRSGRSMDRPGLQELLAYACKGDTLAVVRLDRLGRSLGELLATVTMLKERGIALLSLQEKIDTSSAAGELVFHVFGAIAHFERGSSPSGRRTVSRPLVREESARPPTAGHRSCRSGSEAGGGRPIPKYFGRKLSRQTG